MQARERNFSSERAISAFVQGALFRVSARNSLILRERFTT
jgi:hypothetical protein